VESNTHGFYLRKGLITARFMEDDAPVILGLRISRERSE